MEKIHNIDNIVYDISVGLSPETENVELVNLVLSAFDRFQKCIDCHNQLNSEIDMLNKKKRELEEEISKRELIPAKKEDNQESK